jgi:hypothetical protein
MNNEHCEHCGARLKKYWHGLSQGLVRTLIKIYKGVADKKENMINPHHELDLTTVEHMNMTKLRFHGLIAKVKEDGEVQRGFWLITQRGADFLKGQIQVPSRVQTFRNKVVDHSTDLVTITDVMRDAVYWEKDFSYDVFTPTQKTLL